ncbi:MAG TPA: DUF742 domain-containing protein [Streptosporangiaceae bacterium]|nr:DUF742 domain-containing protein [Streptosporangiaceae bacterium]
MSEHDWPGQSGRPPFGPWRTGPWTTEARQVFQTPAPTTVPVPPDDPGEEPDAEAGPIVRPFIVTGGRTRPADERLRVETLVTALPSALSAPLSFERRHIVEICQRPLSIAEIANSLATPTGVVRVIIADLVAERYVTVDQPLNLHDAASAHLLERILAGVRVL